MRAEQQHPAATFNPPRRWPGLGDEASGAEQCTPANATEQKRAEQPLSLRYATIPDLEAYLDVTGGWTPDAAPSLMDMLVDELIPPSSPEALDLVNYDAGCGATGPYKLLIASAITLLQRDEQLNGVLSTAAVVDELTKACRRGDMVLRSREWRDSGRPAAVSIPIVRRPNEARRLA